MSEVLISEAASAVATDEATAVSSEMAKPARLPRLLGDVRGQAEGPTLICVAGLHGNEPAGVEALRNILPLLAANTGDLQGRVVGLIGNRGALAQGRRFLVHDLNRHWVPERVARLRAATTSHEAEDGELLELDAVLQRILAEAEDRRVFMIDMHTTSGPGSAFANLEDTLPNRTFALELPIPLVVGIEEELAGTLALHLANQGVTTLGIEAGQHDDPAPIGRAEAAIWIALEAAGILPRGRRPEVAAARQHLHTEGRLFPHVVEVRHRHPVALTDHFHMQPGFVNFDAVQAGQVIAHDRAGPIAVPEKGLILMPLYQDQGEDGYFLVRKIRPFWLHLSTGLRRLRLERILHWLPGVRRHPDVRSTFVVDRRMARWFALEIFHLLGFRRHGKQGTFLVVSRREHDA